jgi:hypothetical protein
MYLAIVDELGNVRISVVSIGLGTADSGTYSLSVTRGEGPPSEVDKLVVELNCLAGRLRVPLGGDGPTNSLDSGLSSRARTEP